MVEATRSVHEGDDGRLATRADDEVTLEVANLAASARDLGTQVDQAEGPQRTGFLGRFSTSTPPLSSAAWAVQVTPEAPDETSGAVGVDALVDRLGRDRVTPDAAGTRQLDGDRRG